MNIRSLISIIFLIIFGLNVSAQYTSMDKKANREIPLDDKVRYGKLENGFTYYLRDNDSETTEFRLVVRAGLYHEEKNELDYAHLMEHMVFKYPRNFPFETDFFGTAGRYHYARTTYFDTFYYAQIPSLDKEGKINAFQLLRDHARLENFDSRAIDVERGAIIGEGRYTDIHATWINDTLEHLVLQNTNLDLTSRAEYKSSMMNFDREAFIKFHDDWYRPDIQAAIIVGNIDVDSAESNIRSLFADLKMPKNPKNAREKVIKDINSKKETLDKLIKEEIKKTEQEIDVLKENAPEKINKIAIETSSELVKKLIGAEVNNSSLSAIVEDLLKRNGDKYYGN